MPCSKKPAAPDSTGWKSKARALTSFLLLCRRWLKWPSLQVNAAKGELDRLTVYLPTAESVKERAFDLMRQYPLLPTNAYHLACSLEAGVNAFASLDEDLLLVDGIIVYTCVP